MAKKRTQPEYLPILRTELRLVKPTKEDLQEGMIPMDSFVYFDHNMSEVYSQISPEKWEALVEMYYFLISQADDMFVDGLLEIGEERLNKGVR